MPKKEMEAKEPTTVIEWIKSVSLADGINILLMVVFFILITILVVRTFKNKPSA